MKKRYQKGKKILPEIQGALMERLNIKSTNVLALVIEEALSEAQINGIRLAASVAGDYDRHSMHPYLVSECILGKLNVLKGKPRPNPTAKSLDKAISGIDRKLDSVEANTKFMAGMARARKKLNFEPLVDRIFKEARTMAGSCWPSADATKWAMNKLVEVLK